MPSKSARRGLPPALQVVYMWLCDYSDDDDTSYPSRKTIAIDCGMSVRTVDKACSELEKLGLIKHVQRHKNGELITNLYTVIAVEGSAKSALPSENTALGSAENDPTPSAKSAHRTQPIKNSTQLTKSTAIAVGETPAFGRSEINEMFDEWESVLGYKIESNRQKNRFACSNLIKKHGKDGLVAAMRGVAATMEDQYAPRISDFIELQRRWNELMAWGMKRRQTNGGKPRIVNV